MFPLNVRSTVEPFSVVVGMATGDGRGVGVEIGIGVGFGVAAATKVFISGKLSLLFELIT